MTTDYRIQNLCCQSLLRFFDVATKEMSNPDLNPSKGRAGIILRGGGTKLLAWLKLRKVVPDEGIILC